MTISVNNPVTQTVIFSILLIIGILISIRKRKDYNFFPISRTNELKGLAILFVIFAHIGYYLSTDTRFLFPLSIFAGIGVDLFLFVSGYGLALSQAKHRLNPIAFYLRRMIRLYIPLWIALIVLLSADALLLHRLYPLWEAISSFLGIFQHADLYTNIDSPLWFITFILMYYIVFPFVFWKKYPFVSAVILFILGYLLVYFSPAFFQGVIYLYGVHIMAFPLGVAVAGVVLNAHRVSSQWIKIHVYMQKHKILEYILRWVCLVISAFIVVYFGIHSGIGHGMWMEMLTSTIILCALIIFILIQPFRISLFEFIGVYSYEIYLFHWPLMYRYDIFFRFMPAWLALSMYIVLFVGIGWVLQQVSHRVTKVLLV